MRYELQHLEPITIRQPGRKCNAYITSRWKEIMLSDDKDVFKEYEKLKNYRIFDRHERQNEREIK